jgi:hypothetical protein
MEPQQFALREERFEVINGQRVTVRVYDPVPAPKAYWELTDEELGLVPKADVSRVTYNGVTQHLQVWAKQTGIPYKILRDRLWAGWDVDDLLRVRPGSKEEHYVTPSGVSR